MGEERRGAEWRQREQDIWRLRVSGLTQLEIADRMQMTQGAVSQALKRLGERYGREFVEEQRQVKLQQTAILEQTASEAFTQWRRSCEDAVSEVTVKGKTEGGEKGGQNRAQVTRTIEGQSGNPALLAQARGALSDIREIWGMNAPARLEASGPGGGPVAAFSEIIVQLAPQSQETPAEALPDALTEDGAGGLVIDLPAPAAVDPEWSGDDE